jgi:hypothetical protein
MAKRKQKPIANGIEFDSQDEVEFYWWCCEAIEHGILDQFRCQFPTFELAPSVTRSVPQVGKNGRAIAPKVTTILREVTYTADFELSFFPGVEPKDLGFELFGLGKVLVDVKPAFERDQSRQRKFSVLQKWVWKEHQRFVQPIVPIELFRKTWCPARAFFTPTGKPRNSKQYSELKTIGDALKESQVPS